MADMMRSSMMYQIGTLRWPPGEDKPAWPPGSGFPAQRGICCLRQLLLGAVALPPLLQTSFSPKAQGLLSASQAGEARACQMAPSN
jgi:hypothetical protein